MKVLLIDDEEDIRKIARLSLEAVGKFQVILAANAAEGIDLAKRERPDLILLDMMMPGADGLAALAEVKRTAEIKDTPVIFMTARAQRADVAHYLSVGAIGVILKPFDPMTLSHEIRELMAKHVKSSTSLDGVSS